MKMKWNTRITEMLGCEYPILQASLSGFGKWQFAAAVSNSGAHGCITAHVSRTPERLRDDIRRCRDATDKPFLVNATVGSCTDEMLDVILDEGIDAIETSVYDAGEWGKRIKEAGRKWIHKTSTVRHAVHAEHQGADAVIIVGLEGIGVKNIAQLPTLTTAVLAAREIKVPLIMAGGIGDARGLLAVMALGADGIMMGTRFMATEECPMSERHKKNMVELSADHPRLRHRVLGEPDPKEYEEVMKQRGKIPMGLWLSRLEKVMLKDSGWENARSMNETSVTYWGGLISMAVGVIHDIPSCKELVDRIVTEAEEIAGGWQFLR